MAVKKSQGVGTVTQRRQLLDIDEEVPSRKRQCELPGLARSSTYYKKRSPKDELATERAIEQLYEEAYQKIVWNRLGLREYCNARFCHEKSSIPSMLVTAKKIEKDSAFNPPQRG